MTGLTDRQVRWLQRHHEDGQAILDVFIDQQIILGDVVEDFDRRRSTRWGRLLLWLLRKTT